MSNRFGTKKYKLASIIAMSISGPIAIMSASFIGVSVNKKETLTINSYDSVDDPVLTITQGIGMSNYGHYYSIYIKNRDKQFVEVSPEELQLLNDGLDETKGSYTNYVHQCKSLKSDIKSELNTPGISKEAKEIHNRRLKFVNTIESNYTICISGIVLLPISIFVLLMGLTVLLLGFAKGKDDKKPRTIVVDTTAPKIVIKKSNA